MLTTATIVPGFLAASDRQSKSSSDTSPERKAVVPWVAEGRSGREPANEADKYGRNSPKAEAIALAAKAFGPEHLDSGPDMPGRYSNRMG